MAETETRTQIIQVGTVMVPVSNQDRALEFFLDKLGFEKRTDTPYGDGERWVEVAPPGAATTIALVPPREGAASPALRVASERKPGTADSLDVIFHRLPSLPVAVGRGSHRKLVLSITSEVIEGQSRGS